MKTREVTIFSGHRFAVPQCIQRIDHRYTHGWQVRYGGTKMFSDASNDGSGAAKALELATKELIKRIIEMPSPSKLQQTRSASKTSKLPVGISGPIVRQRANTTVPHCSLQVLLPKFGSSPRNRNIYIGSQRTYTVARFKQALKKAIAWRTAAEQAYMEAETRARRAGARAMKTMLKTGTQQLPTKRKRAG